MEDDEFSLASVLKRTLDRHLEAADSIDDIDPDELARELASDAESHFGM
jgi:hypothetical protein